jgi:hypothetical protein
MKLLHLVGAQAPKYPGIKSSRGERAVALSYVFAGVGGYYASKPTSACREASLCRNAAKSYRRPGCGRVRRLSMRPRR